MISLTENESALIVDALNGIMIQPEILAESILWQEIEEAIKIDHLDAKWSIDGATLVAKLKSASHEDATRVIELAQKFWDDQNQNIFDRVRVIGMANVAPEGDEFVTATQAAKLSGKSMSSLAQLVSRGKLNVYPDLDEPNPQKRNRYLKSQVAALAKVKPRARKSNMSIATKKPRAKRK